ncbi:hypothetical protein EGH55_20400 [Klebsiella aerogenes]|nr:hypothetical protein EGH55_20400 [Klebsiella aerogenes]
MIYLATSYAQGVLAGAQALIVLVLKSMLILCQMGLFMVVNHVTAFALILGRIITSMAHDILVGIGLIIAADYWAGVGLTVIALVLVILFGLTEKTMHTAALH